MPQTKHFGHDEFTGYVRLRFFFLLAATCIYISPDRKYCLRGESVISGEVSPSLILRVLPTIPPRPPCFVLFQTFAPVSIMNALYRYIFPGHEEFLRARRSLAKIHDLRSAPFIKPIVPAIESAAYPDRIRSNARQNSPASAPRFEKLRCKLRENRLAPRARAAVRLHSVRLPGKLFFRREHAMLALPARRNVTLSPNSPN